MWIDNFWLPISSRGINYTIKYHQSGSLVSQSKNEVSSHFLVKISSLHVGAFLPPLSPIYLVKIKAVLLVGYSLIDEDHASLSQSYTPPNYCIHLDGERPCEVKNLAPKHSTVTQGITWILIAIGLSHHTSHNELVLMHIFGWLYFLKNISLQAKNNIVAFMCIKWY